MSYTKHLSEPHFTNVCSGLKTVEGRPSEGSFGKMNEGDIIVFYNDDTGTRRECAVRIAKITHHLSFINMLKAHGLKRVLPDTQTFDEGLMTYKLYYPMMFDSDSLNEPGDKLRVLGLVLELLE